MPKGKDKPLKKLKPTDIVSVREFARQMGVSDTLVRRYYEDLKPALVQLENGRPAIKFGTAKDLWENLGAGTATQAGGSFDGKRKSQQQLFDSDVDEDSDDEIEPAYSLPSSREHSKVITDAKKVKTVYDAKFTKLKFEQADGLLVYKSDVYQALFVIGQRLRQGIMEIPDAYIDLIRSAEDRHEAHQILTDALSDKLLVLSDMDNMEFGND